MLLLRQSCWPVPILSRGKLPVSGNQHAFVSDDPWLRMLSHKDLFAVGRGLLKFRGYVPRKKPLPVPGAEAAPGAMYGAPGAMNGVIAGLLIWRDPGPKIRT